MVACGARKVPFLSAFSGQFSKEFLWGKKLVACFLKLVARILKSEPLIFSLLPGGVNALKISFHFSGAENAVFGLRFYTPASRFFLKIFLPRVVPFRQKVLPLQPISTRVDRFVLLATTKKQC